MRAVAQRFNLLRTKTTGKASERLASAGWRSRDALVVFMVAKLCLPFVFGAAAFVLVDVLGFGNIRPPLRSLVPLLAVGLGAYAPDIFVRNAMQKRQKAIQKGLPDALDLLIICAEAGLSLDAAMTRVSREMERSCPELTEEFGLLAIELGFVPDRRQALMNLIKRCPLPSMRGVVNTLLQTEKYGTPLAKALRVLSTEFRNDRMMRAEEKAARLPAILTVPMIVFILPVLMIVLVGPAALRVMDAFRSM
jgi:tight adherence protein C